MKIIRIAKWAMAVLALLSIAVWVIAANGYILIPLLPPNATSYERGVYIGRGIVARAIFGGPTPYPKFQWIGHGTWFASPDEFRILCAPAWSLPGLMLPLTAALFYADRRRRIPSGHCRCGYDLTGNVSGVCPECGATIATTPNR